MALRIPHPSFSALVLVSGLFLPETLPAGVVLEAGEIDSSKVIVGAFAEVVYGKGKRDPVSGEWEKLVTASGYIKAVDAERLILAVGGDLKEQIPFLAVYPDPFASGMSVALGPLLEFQGLSQLPRV